MLRAGGFEIFDQVPWLLARFLLLAAARTRSGRERARTPVSIQLLLHLVEHARLAVAVHHRLERTREDVVCQDLAFVDASGGKPVGAAFRVAAEKPARASGGSEIHAERTDLDVVHEHLVVLVVEYNLMTGRNQMFLSAYR